MAEVSKNPYVLFNSPYIWMKKILKKVGGKN